MTTNNKEKIADLLINVYPDDNEKDYDITFKIVNNAFAPFHQVDYFLNGIFKDVNLMSEINSNGLKDDKKIQNRKNRIYTNGKIIHPIYKLNKKRIDKVVSDDNDNDNDDDSIYGDEDYSIYGDEDDSIDGDEDYSNDEDDSNEDDSNEDDSTIQQNRKRRRYSSKRGGNKKNKKQHRKTKKHSKK